MDLNVSRSRPRSAFEAASEVEVINVSMYQRKKGPPLSEIGYWNSFSVTLSVRLITTRGKYLSTPVEILY